jgi:hypothetical protein
MATGFGRDTWCTDRYVSGRYASAEEALGQALFRRLITPRGTLQGVIDEDEELNYGLDLAGYVGAIGYPIAIAALPGLVDGELAKDDRVLSVATAIEQSLDTNNGEIEITLTIDVTPQEPLQDFTLTLAVSDVTAELVGITVSP